MQHEYKEIGVRILTADSSHGERTGGNNTFNLVMEHGAMAPTLIKTKIFTMV